MKTLLRATALLALLLIVACTDGPTEPAAFDEICTCTPRRPRLPLAIDTTVTDTLLGR